MRRSFFFVLFLLSFLFAQTSCEDTPIESIETRNLHSNKTGVFELNVDHYMQIAYGPFPGLFHITRKGEKVGDENWQIQYDPITNFDYEWGYRYHLLVNKQKFNPQMIDGPAYEYETIEVLSKKKVDKNEQFKLTLKQFYDDGGSDNFIEGDAKSGYSFLGVKNIYCGKFCDELSEIDKIDKSVIGIFEHHSEGKIALVGLENK